MNTPIRTFLVMSFALVVGYGLITFPFVATRISVPFYPSLCDYGWTRFAASKECFFVDVNKVYFSIPLPSYKHKPVISNDDLWVSSHKGGWAGNMCEVITEEGKLIDE